MRPQLFGGLRLSPEIPASIKDDPNCKFCGIQHPEVPDVVCDVCQAHEAHRAALREALKDEKLRPLRRKMLREAVASVLKELGDYPYNLDETGGAEVTIEDLAAALDWEPARAGFVVGQLVILQKSQRRAAEELRRFAEELSTTDAIEEAITYGWDGT